MDNKRVRRDDEPAGVGIAEQVPDIEERRHADEQAADRGGQNITGGTGRDPSKPFER